MEENSGELGYDLPRIRYKNGLPSTNRTMVGKLYMNVYHVLCKIDFVLDYWQSSLLIKLCSQIARRRASIATIPRPLTSHDIIKA